ncbi:SURF1 family protein [Brevundimonas sp. Root1279]|uniref:SURF1 family protein n=1 Tax=Brevundimonas sp. Root1279 TaxID=1736443 RepID=UPI0006FB9C41|nr:SURF1 family protein [Brevundimonas sp. Root1279]KQW82570.1 Surfeit locus 1 family protein [Brevundimonas sp. Root1279]
MTEAARRRFPWGLTVVAALALALLLSLGVWQVQRLHWKQGLITQAETAVARPPAPLATVLASGSPEFRKASIDCPGLASAPYVELQSIHDGQAGVRLISACRPAGQERAFLVDRGFVADEISARPPVASSTVPMTVAVELRQTPPPGAMAPPPQQGRFYARDSAAMAEALQVGEVSPWTLFALTSSNPEWQALHPSAPPAAFSNNHLGYALTWFGLALALIAFYIALLRRKLSPQSATPSERGNRTTKEPL